MRFNEDNVLNESPVIEKDTQEKLGLSDEEFKKYCIISAYKAMDRMCIRTIDHIQEEKLDVDEGLCFGVEVNVSEMDNYRLYCKLEKVDDVVD